ncbi:MAG: hypothetical protein K4571_06125 [Deltaproteobacteria bacterium]
MKLIRSFNVLVGLCFIFSLGSGAVYAQSLQEKADADRDQAVAREEMKSALDIRYKNEDANQDGKVTTDEYLQARQKNFDDADQNQDKVVVVEEWVIYWCGTAGDAARVRKPLKMDRTASRSKRMDTSKDGKIQTGECVAFWAGRFVDLDGNKDGKMTRDEYISKMMAMAKAMDLNNDGIIMIDEYYISWIGKDKAPARNRKPAK